MAIEAFFTLLFLLFALLFSGLWIGITLLVVGYVGLISFTSISAGSVLSNVLWNQAANSTMLALPLFIFMGEVLVKSKIADSLFLGLAPWVNRLPGGLLHVNTAACAFFAAVSGSVAATTATVGGITIPEFRKRGYSDSLSIGTLACAGTLGILIPPSMPMLVYGFISSVSIGKLFIAGIMPGLALAVLFSGYVIVRCLINPSLAPSQGDNFTWSDRMAGLPQLLPVILLILTVLGSIYAGFATPTEAAAVGSFGAIVFAFWNKTLSAKVFTDALMGTVLTSCMIMLIVVGASFFSVAIGYIGIPRALARFMVESEMSPYTLMVIVTLFYIVLGCLVDGFSIIVMSVPLVLPLIRAAGFDPLWFGIYLVLMVQVAQITPPVGFNLFVINGLDQRYSLGFIARASCPMFLIMLLFTLLITVFPELILWLPGKIM